MRQWANVALMGAMDDFFWVKETQVRVLVVVMGTVVAESEAVLAAISNVIAVWG